MNVQQRGLTQYYSKCAPTGGRAPNLLLPPAVKAGYEAGIVPDESSLRINCCGGKLLT